MRSAWNQGYRPQVSDSIAIAAGRRDRMFPELPEQRADPAALLRLAAAMVDRAPDDPRRDNPDMPAGYAILAQFVDHDLTFDPRISGTAEAPAPDEDRAPRLALDSLYGPGPEFAPALYDAARPWRFAIPDAGAPVSDLPRAAAGAAQIGDRHNDGNLAIAQLHLALCRIHNAVADRIPRGATPARRFAEARRLVTWHYQWVVIEDLLPRLCDPVTLTQVRAGRRCLGAADGSLPDEFVGAAFRVVHAMVRERYEVNDLRASGGGAGPAGLDRLFRRGCGSAEAAVGPEWTIDWRRFFAFPAEGRALPRINPCRRIGPQVAPGLDSLLDAPAGTAAAPGRLAARNLLRGQAMGLPSGQAVARAMGVAPLTPAQIATGPDGAIAAAAGLLEATPLWHYLLKEAQLLCDGRHLGPVASQIVAETLLSVAEETPESYPAAVRPWRPTLPRRDRTRFDMVDFLRVGGVARPVGDGVAARPRCRAPSQGRG